MGQPLLNGYKALAHTGSAVFAKVLLEDSMGRLHSCENWVQSANTYAFPS